MTINSIDRNGYVILDIPQQQELQTAFNLYFGHPYPQRNSLTKNRLWNALNDYIQFCIDYFTSELGDQSPTPDEVAPVLFVTGFENWQQYQRFLKVAIYAAKEYAIDLLRRLNRQELDRYEELVLTIESDFENLIVDYERVVKKQNRNAQYAIGSRNHHLISDGKWAAQSMVFIEQELSARKPDFRGIRPYSLFIDRQCLEIAGNNLIGFEKVVDKNGSDIHKFTQVGWKFLAERSKVAEADKGWRVELPYKIETIRALVGWTNSFVHQMIFYRSYIQHYAMDLVWKILSSSGGENTVFGTRCSSEYGKFLIYNYRNLKRDFEHYVKIENGNKDATVIWKPLEQVGAYLTSLGSGKVLYVMHTPPPVHGASMVGQYIKDSSLLQQRFESEYINLTAASDLNDIGRFNFRKVGGFVKMLWHIRKAIKKGHPDVVCITPNAAGRSFYKDFITVCFIKRWAGYSILEYKFPIRIVWNRKHRKKNDPRKPNILLYHHNKGVKEFSKSKMNNWLYKKFYKDAYVLLLSEILYEDVKKYISLSRCMVCGNGIPKLNAETDERVLNNLRGKYEDETNQAIHILFLSNMMEEKGVWTLVDACKILKDKGVSFKCTFVGGWKDINKKAFDQKTMALGLQAEVTAVGAKYGDDKEAYWLDADVFVFPTYYHNECFPLVLLEAMQHALPCISTKEGAIPDIIDDGVTGFVIDSKNPNALAAKIMELANDKDKRLDMGIKGCGKFKERYTLNVFESRMCNILEQLV